MGRYVQSTTYIREAHKKGVPDLSILINWVAAHWTHVLLIVLALGMGKALGDEISLCHPKGIAARLARLVASFYFALFFYALGFYIYTLARSALKF